MILSDGDIRKAIADGRIAIDPFDEADVQPSSVDLHCDRYFRVFHNARYPFIDVKKPMEDLTELVEVSEDEPFILHPGEFVLGSTMEYVRLPNDVVARLEGKSSLGRLGLLIHSSLPGDEQILFLHDGQLRLRRIDEVVTKRLEGCVVSFDPTTFTVGYHAVTGWWEGAPDRIFEVALASGRKVKLTGGHDLFTLDPTGELVKVPIHSVAPATKVAIARHIPDPPLDAAVTIDLARLAPESLQRDLVCGGPSVVTAWQNERSVKASLRAMGIGPAWQISIPYREHKLLTAVPALTDLLISTRRALGIDQKTAARVAGFRYPTQLNNLERGRRPGVRLRTLRAVRDGYAARGATSPTLDRVVDGDVCWDEVVEVRDTGRVEPVFDLEVRPGGRRIENFLAGYGGVFVSNTAGYVDPGFEGHLTLELSNVANLPITIYPGMKIGQISFFTLSSEAENPYGSQEVGSKYQGQRGPTPSRYYKNFD